MERNTPIPNGLECGDETFTAALSAAACVRPAWSLGRARPPRALVAVFLLAEVIMLRDAKGTTPRVRYRQSLLQDPQCEFWLR